MARPDHRPYGPPVPPADGHIRVVMQPSSGTGHVPIEIWEGDVLRASYCIAFVPGDWLTVDTDLRMLESSSGKAV